MYQYNQAATERLIKQWLDEDTGNGDITTLATIPADHVSRGIIHSKDQGIVAGLDAAEQVFAIVDSAIIFKRLVSDGDALVHGTVIAEVEGSTRSILTGERLALNLLQRMSAIATKTKTYVEAVVGLEVRIVDTRKTTPGHRALEKYAVRVGGGANHRFGLYDAVMIKDNHIKGSGGIAQAVRAAKSLIPHTMKVEVEVEHMGQLEEALQAGADIIMLDNMSNEAMKQAVSIIKSTAPHVVVEASGGITLKTIRGIAETGVDVISVGALTHSINAHDISLDLFQIKEDLS